MLQAIRGRRKDDSPGQQDAQDADTAQESEKKLGKNPKNDIGPNAEVWRKYVEETDRYDKDMVDGWNNSLDVLLIFASLFSAVSSAFVLESTQDLKPDYAESSAQTLAAILQAVSAGSPTNTSDVSSTSQAEFSPSHAAITVNILWFMSLSLSVAVALIAIVAKDWCYQFMSGRTGQHILQGRRRQLRWEGIEKWKMQEILNVLPLMMHAALLLFAVGLSLYLWDINPRVALPVVVTTALVGLFYLITLFLPLFFRYCPFTTGLIKLFLPYWYKVAGPVYKRILEVLGWLLVPFLVTPALIRHLVKQSPGQTDDSERTSLKLSLRRRISEISFKDFWNNTQSRINDRIESMSSRLLADRSQLGGQDTPMDEVTSSMLGWMIAQCEDSRSVDVAFHALVCVKPWLPREPLVRCGAFEATFARLITYLSAWLYSNDTGNKDDVQLRRSVVLQSQCVSMMSHSKQIEQPKSYASALYCLHLVLNRCWDPDEDKDYDLASKELGNLSLHMLDEPSIVFDYRQQVTRQWELLGMIVSKQVTTLSPTDIYHLIDGIAKSYLYRPEQPPTPLLELLSLPEFKDNYELRRMIGIALTMACVTNYNYPGCILVPDRGTRLKRARELYIELTTKEPSTRDRWDDYEQVMHFGLIGMLLIEPGSEWSPLKSVMGKILAIDVPELAENAYSFLGLPHDLITVAINWLLGTTHTTDHDPPSNPPTENVGGVTIEIDAPSTAGPSRGVGHDTPKIASNRLDDPVYLEHAKQIIRLVRCRWSLADRYSAGALMKIHKTSLPQRLYQTIDSNHEDIIPHCTSFIWVFTRSLLLVHHNVDDEYYIPEGFNALSILEPLGAHGDLPKDIGGMGFADSWIEKLEAACERDPQSVLESEVLEEMIKYYTQDENRELQPSAVGASGTEPPKTWLSILTDLSQACQTKIDATKAKQGATTEGVNETEGVDEMEGEEAQEKPMSQMDGKSTGDRIAEEGANWDQLPPEVLEYAQPLDPVRPMTGTNPPLEDSVMKTVL